MRSRQTWLPALTVVVSDLAPAHGPTSYNLFIASVYTYENDFGTCS
jgi:hypothetical protein